MKTLRANKEKIENQIAEMKSLLSKKQAEINANESEDMLAELDRISKIDYSEIDKLSEIIKNLESACEDMFVLYSSDNSGE